MGIEPTTLGLGSRCSATELLSQMPRRLDHSEAAKNDPSLASSRKRVKMRNETDINSGTIAIVAEVGLEPTTHCLYQLSYPAISHASRHGGHGPFNILT